MVLKPKNSKEMVPLVPLNHSISAHSCDDPKVGTAQDTEGKLPVPLLARGKAL